MESIHTEEYKGYTLSIIPDEDGSNPRTEFDNAAHFICWHRRYDLGDEHKHSAPESLFESLARQVDAHAFDKLWDKWDADKIDENTLRVGLAAIVQKHCVIIPLNLYDHSGISISASGGYPYNDVWDAGQVGYAYMTRAEVIKEYGKWDKASKAQARGLILCEIETYNDYLTGNVYGYQVEDYSGEVLDSCWGFFGDYEYCLGEARRSADYLAQERDARVTANEAQLTHLKQVWQLG